MCLLICNLKFYLIYIINAFLFNSTHNSTVTTFLVHRSSFEILFPSSPPKVPSIQNSVFSGFIFQQILHKLKVEEKNTLHYSFKVT